MSTTDGGCLAMLAARCLDQLADGRQDPEAARALLTVATASPEVSKAWKVDEWLAQALGRILAGEDANVALGLKRPAHRTTGDAPAMRAAIAAFVELFTRHPMPERRREAGADARADARAMASCKFSRGERSITNACRAHPTVQEFSDRELCAVIHAYHKLREDSRKRTR